MHRGGEFRVWTCAYFVVMSTSHIHIRRFISHYTYIYYRYILINNFLEFRFLKKLLIESKIDVNYIHHEFNVGVNGNFYWAFQQCKGRYIALCEGDDYWLNKNKLQLQVDFLEKSSIHAFCFHNSLCFDQNSQSFTIEFPGLKKNTDFNLDNFIDKNFVPTASVVFLKDFLNPLPEWYKNILYGDYAIYLLVLFRSKKKAHYFSEVMSVYRLHNNGVFTALTKSDSGELKKNKHFIEFYKYFYFNVFDSVYKKRVRDIISYYHLSIILLLLRSKTPLKSIRGVFIFLTFNPLYFFKKIKTILYNKL